MKTILALLFGLAVAGQAQAQTAPAAQHLPRGTATDISNAEILATAQKTAAAPVSDQQIRVVSINGEYNVGVGVVHRAKTEGRDIGFGIEHSRITEIYHVISGNGTFVTGGTIENMKETSGREPRRHDAQRPEFRRRQGPRRAEPRDRTGRCGHHSAEHPSLVHGDHVGPDRVSRGAGRPPQGAASRLRGEIAAGQWDSVADADPRGAKSPDRPTSPRTS